MRLSAGPPPRAAHASPWTLPNDKFVLGLDSNFQTADHEYLPDGTRQAFPLDGQFSALTFIISGRYGITDRLEGAMELEMKQVDYQANPVLLAVPDPSTDKQSLNNSIFNFSKTHSGLGDARLHLRYNFHKGLLMATTETSVKFPVGYQPPQGTFAQNMPDTTAVADDVSLGDGQVDLAQGILFGVYVPPTRSFGRLDLDYVHRFGAPGDQVTGLVSIGQYVGDMVLLFAGADGAYTVFDGEPIGTTYITYTPEKPAGQIGLSDIATNPLTLDKDYVSVEGGVILQVRSMENPRLCGPDRVGQEHLPDPDDVAGRGLLHRRADRRIAAAPAPTAENFSGNKIAAPVVSVHGGQGCVFLINVKCLWTLHWALATLREHIIPP